MRATSLLLALLTAGAGCRRDGEPGTSGGSSSTTPEDDAVDVDALFADAGSLFDLVDPFIATGGQGAQVTGVGPGASAPNGLTLVSPDTRSTIFGAPTWLHLGAYHYDDDLISGFAHTHGHGIGIHDYGALQVMPRASWSDGFTNPNARSAPFDHDAEEAHPGSYAVTLQDDGTEVLIVASLHGAHHRYTFAPGGEPVVVLDLGHRQGTNDILAGTWAEADLAEGTVEGLQIVEGGYSGRFGGLLNHFAMRMDPAPVSVSGWTDPAVVTAGVERVDGGTAGLVLHFPAGTQQVDLRVGLSYVDTEGAWANLDAELPDTDQDARRAEVEAQWRDRLDRVQVVGGSDDDRVVFATALYHTLLMPSRLDDVDGRYRGIDGEIHTTETPYYSDFSLWDTFRTLHPWYLLAWPDLQLDCLRSLQHMVEDGGALPRWPMAHGPTSGMVGTPAAQVLAESYLKGLRDGWDVQDMWDAAWATSVEGGQPYANRGGLEDYQTIGYVPMEASSGSASRTLEFAWSDASLAAWGEALHADAEEIAVYQEQATHWRNLWDPDTRFFRGRYRDGHFEELELEFGWNDDYVEGNAWHYVWYVPYDVEAMIGLQHDGDTAAFLERLSAYWDEVESEPDDGLPDDWYWHGNEPVLHYAALGSLAGDRALSARATDWIATHRYSATPEGLDGNDDAGTLSAWYLWASMGLYPVAGLDQYAVISPRFEGIRIRRDDGDVVVLGTANPGVEVPLHALSMEGNQGRAGEVLEGTITHAQLLSGLWFGAPAAD